MRFREGNKQAMGGQNTRERGGGQGGGGGTGRLLMADRLSPILDKELH